MGRGERVEWCGVSGMIRRACEQRSVVGRCSGACGLDETSDVA